MMDFLERFFDYFILPIFVIFIAIFAVGLLALPIALLSGWEPPSTLAYKECLADGQKEYVCYSMIYGRNGSVK